MMREGQGRSTKSDKQSKMDKKKELTELQKNCCHELIRNEGNQTAAFLEYHKRARKWLPKTQHSKASEFFAKPEVKEFLKELQGDVVELLPLETADIVQYRENLVTVTAKDFYDKDGNMIPIKDLPDHVAEAIMSWSVSKTGVTNIKLYNRAESLTAIEKMRGMYAEDNAQRKDEGKFEVVFVEPEKKEEEKKEELNVPPDKSDRERGVGDAVQ